MKPFNLKSRNVILAVLALSGAAFPAFARDLGTMVDQAVVAYNEGIDAEDNGRYADACRSYRDAAERFESAIYSLIGQSMQTEDERENTKAYADHLQERVDSAKENASRVCAK